MVTEMKSPRGERAMTEAIANGLVIEGEKQSQKPSDLTENGQKNGQKQSDLTISDGKPSQKRSNLTISEGFLWKCLCLFADIAVSVPSVSL